MGDLQKPSGYGPGQVVLRGPAGAHVGLTRQGPTIGSWTQRPPEAPCNLSDFNFSDSPCSHTPALLVWAQAGFSCPQARRPPAVPAWPPTPGKKFLSHQEAVADEQLDPSGGTAESCYTTQLVLQRLVLLKKNMDLQGNTWSNYAQHCSLGVFHLLADKCTSKHYFSCFECMDFVQHIEFLWDERITLIIYNIII